MLRGYGANRLSLNNYETAEELVPDYYDSYDHPHTIPHKNRSKNMKKEGYTSKNEITSENS